MKFSSAYFDRSTNVSAFIISEALETPEGVKNIVGPTIEFRREGRSSISIDLNQEELKAIASVLIVHPHIRQNRHIISRVEPNDNKTSLGVDFDRTGATLVLRQVRVSTVEILAVGVSEAMVDDFKWLVRFFDPSFGLPESHDIVMLHREKSNEAQ